MTESAAAGESLSEIDLGLLIPVLLRYQREGESALLPALQETQGIYGYLPRAALEALSRALPIALSRIYGVTTFYSQFHLVPRGRNIVRCCQGTACHVKGGKRVLAALKESLGVEEGETTSDLRFTLETVACLGCCSLAPAVLINNRYFGRMTAGRVGSILKDFR
jgi:NADH-quinone oxidoreductase subunit E